MIKRTTDYKILVSLSGKPPCTSHRTFYSAQCCFISGVVGVICAREQNRKFSPPCCGIQTFPLDIVPQEYPPMNRLTYSVGRNNCQESIQRLFTDRTFSSIPPPLEQRT